MLSRIGINDFPRSVRLYSTLGGICAEDMVALNLEAEHRTVANLETRNAFAFDQMQNGYYAIGEKVGQAWNSGADLTKK